MKVTENERGILAMIRLNAVFPKDEIIIRRKIGRLAIKFHWRSSKNLWGRFGGGWNWMLGFQSSASTLIVNLLVCSVRFDIEKRSAK